MKKAEESLQISVSKYIKLKYPKVVFTSESSGVRLTMGQAVKAKMMRSEDALPDLIVLKRSGQYCGLLIELKQTKYSPFLKDGSISKDKHVQEQLATLLKLREEGYCAVFGVGIDNCMSIIDAYMRGATINHLGQIS